MFLSWKFRVWGVLSLIWMLGSSVSIWASKGSGVTTAKNLLQATNARTSALGEAASALTDDISILGYNPSSLKTLSSGHASIMYHRGLTDDSFGQISMGAPWGKTSLGAHVGFYDGGSIVLNDGTRKRTIRAQSDLLLSAGLARSWGQTDWGITGKFFSSELAESAQAQAYAVDVGVGRQLHPRLRLGMAIQNMGTQVEYTNRSVDMPRVARAGLAYSLMTLHLPTTLMVEVPYFMVEEELRPALGLETKMGPMSLRAGYRSQVELHQLSFGAGIHMGSFDVDYAFGLIDDLETSHRISLSMRFAHPDLKNETADTLVAIPEEDPLNETELMNQEISQITLTPVKFLFDSDVIDENSYETLNQVADVMEKYPELNLRVEGHTDNVGRHVYNLNLSEKRALAVKKYLLQKGRISEAAISSEGYGENKPVVPNFTEEGRNQNRRVEFIFEQAE